MVRVRVRVRIRVRARAGAIPHAPLPCRHGHNKYTTIVTVRP